MSGRRILNALVFATIGAGIQLVAGFGLWEPFFAFAVGGAITAGSFGFLAGLNDIYSLRPRAIWAFVLDVSWSAVNTLTGFLWLVWCARTGVLLQPNADTRDRGIILFSGPALPGADATTIGTVIGGRWLLHEAVHVQQARIFGPLYWPTYLIGYGLNLLVLVATGRLRDAHWEAYGRVVMEDWAYRAAPVDDARRVEAKPTVRWLLLATLNAVGVALLLGPLVGLALAPWWTGAILLLGYAFVRSLHPRARWTALPSIP